MQIYSNTAALPREARGAVAALGNFDGLHRGHRAVLHAARALAAAGNRPFAAVTFEPHPHRVFFPGDAPFRLTPPVLKRELLAEMGVEILYEIPFTPEFAKVPAREFMQRILLEELDLAHAVAGHDFVFGHKRAGGMPMLRDFFGGRERSVTEIAPQRDAGRNIWSSTRIRAQLQAGDVKGAAEALGRPWEIESVVQKGDGAGRRLGFPTANLDLGETLRPRLGVYAVRAKLDGVKIPGVANLGVRPTLGGRDERFEVHLFDFSGEIYGKTLRVALLHFIRPEQAFPSLAALSARIAEDCDAARALLGP